MAQQTPKEKAQELNWKYAEILYLLHDARALKNSYAKKSALIAVDEILNNFPDEFWPNYTIDNTSYWQEVKYEIEKL